jgi:23S rRNA (cytidine2498-2'-O)-methyltransferase
LDALLPSLLIEAAPLIARVPLGATASVQTRVLSGPLKPFQVNEALAARLAAAGHAIDVRAPEWVLSVALAGGTVFLGVSAARDNLSDWAGGCRRFAREAEQVSRAEFKLLEALEMFSIPIRSGGSALDLGASPGGWTRVLRARGLTVTAVDPAALDARLADDPGITHHRETAQAFLASQKAQPAAFDLLVNDMKMETGASAALMVQAARLLRPDGFAVLTLKLPSASWMPLVRRARTVLAGAYGILGVRQLFHNRSEVTCALRAAGIV